MNLQDTVELLLPRALAWLQAEEARVLRDGVPLNGAELARAALCGVGQPERVRLLRVAEMPQPDDALLQAAARESGFALASAGGLTLGRAVLIHESQWRDAALVAHELVHVAQYERLGDEGFLRLYLHQYLTVGYGAAPLEREAVERSRAALIRFC